MTKMKSALQALADGPPFPVSLKVHELEGALKGVFDLHVSHNWLILFRFQSKSVIELLRTGTHASINLTE